MRQLIRLFTAMVAGTLVLFLPQFTASAQSASQDDKASGTAEQPQTEADKVPEIDLLAAMRQKLVSVKAEGTGDGRMTMSITNKTHRKLRVILPPGIIAQGATGQFGGMGGGGGGMGGGMGGGGMGGGMGGGGMGGGMGGMGGMGGGMGGMGGMGRMAGTMPPMMGMMMLARMIMYFCGDPDSWDMRSLMMGMGGMGMGGMGGGMGGMGGGMGGMGGGMRSVPPTLLPSADLNPGQTRNLPTSLVSISTPDPESGVSLPEKGERLQIVGDVSGVVSDPKVQKALSAWLPTKHRRRSRRW